MKVGLLIAAHDFLKKKSKRIPIVNFISSKPYNNNKIKITFTRCNARVFFLVKKCMNNRLIGLQKKFLKKELDEKDRLIVVTFHEVGPHIKSPSKLV